MTEQERIAASVKANAEAITALEGRFGELAMRFSELLLRDRIEIERKGSADARMVHTHAASLNKESER